MPRAKPKAANYDHLFEVVPPLRSLSETEDAAPKPAFMSWAEDAAAALQTAYVRGLREELGAKIDELLDTVKPDDSIAIGTVKALRIVQKKLDSDAETAKRILNGTS